MQNEKQTLTNEEALDVCREIHEVDACEFCFGEKGGVPGNENILTMPDGSKKIACDYCSVAHDPIAKMTKEL